MLLTTTVPPLGDVKAPLSELIGRVRDLHERVTVLSARVHATDDSMVFFVYANGLVTRVTDFWPKPYEPPSGREHLVER